jgi:hypothetical protein
MRYYGLDTVDAVNNIYTCSASIDLNRRYKNPIRCKVMPLCCKLDIQSVPLCGNALRNGGRVVLESQVICNDGFIYEK